MQHATFLTSAQRAPNVRQTRLTQRERDIIGDLHEVFICLAQAHIDDLAGSISAAARMFLPA